MRATFSCIYISIRYAHIRNTHLYASVMFFGKSAYRVAQHFGVSWIFWQRDIINAYVIYCSVFIIGPHVVCLQIDRHVIIAEHVAEIQSHSASVQVICEPLIQSCIVSSLHFLLSNHLTLCKGSRYINCLQIYNYIKFNNILDVQCW